LNGGGDVERSTRVTADKEETMGDVSKGGNHAGEETEVGREGRGGDARSTKVGCVKVILDCDGDSDIVVVVVVVVGEVRRKEEGEEISTSGGGVRGAQGGREI
jgi:hypothetical protein